MKFRNLLLLTLCFCPTLIPAKEAPAFELGWQDAGWISGGVLIQIPAQIQFRNMSSADTANLRRQDLLYLDRWAAGAYSTQAALASDLLVLPFGALPMALTAMGAFKNNQGFKPIVTDAVIYSEAIAFSSAFSLLFRSLQIHPRPLVYGKQVPAKERLKSEASGSFYSGHTNAAFLTAVYLSYTYPIRHPEFKGEGWLWTGSLTVATAIAALRIGAGKHFPSDIIAGAAAGAFFGWVFPRLHLNSKSNRSVYLDLKADSEGVYPRVVLNF